ncbi:MAG TPA: DUF4097 family beta strand repeat-containing protein [Acidobacteriaceae bacterium]
MRRSICLSVTLLALFVTGCHRSHSTSSESLSDSLESVTGTSDGALDINKMGGDIAVAEAPGGAKLHTMGGSIVVDKVEKSLEANTSGGDVTIHSANVSTLKASTMGGNIDINSAQATDLQISTMGGNIDIGSAQAADLHATTMGGTITAQTLSDGSINLKSMGGTIELTIPKNSSAQIDIELSYSLTSGQHYTITDNLGLQQQTSSWNFSHFFPRKTIYAKGTIGSGKNHIVIRTIGGNVVLKAL